MAVSELESIRDFPAVPVIKNPPSNSGEAGLIPGLGSKIPHDAYGQKVKKQKPMSL